MTNKGDFINGAIVSGSVDEIAVPAPGGGGSVNEWFIGFEIIGGTGRHAGATGHGHVHMVWDSGGGYSDIPGVYQSDPARFAEHELFLHLD